MNGEPNFDLEHIKGLEAALIRYVEDDYCQQKLGHCQDMTNETPDVFCGQCKWCQAQKALGYTCI